MLHMKRHAAEHACLHRPAHSIAIRQVWQSMYGRACFKIIRSIAPLEKDACYCWVRRMDMLLFVFTIQT